VRFTRDRFAGGQLLTAEHPKCDQPVRRLFVSGNSHALAYSTLLERLASEQPIDVRVYFVHGCALFELSVPIWLEKQHCRPYYESVLADLRARARPGDVLFLPSLRLERFVDQWAPFPESEQRHKMSDAVATLRRASALAETEPRVAQLIKAGVTVIFEAPKPIFRAPPFRCSDWFNAGNPICAPGLSIDRADLLAYREPVMKELAELRSNEGARVWDPFDTLCPGSTCKAFAGGEPLFFDGDHLSAAGNELLYPSFQAFLAAPAN
jgi:hypothetical protein